MTIQTDPPGPIAPIDLAREQDFVLGASKVSPSTREILRGTERELLEPRVMQVLVALFRANGRVVSRDELIARCWEGRIVGEDAINRAISRLRRLSEVDHEASFQLETIPRVGYRLLPTGTPSTAIGHPAPSASDAAAPARQNIVMRHRLAFTAAAIVAAVALTIFGVPIGGGPKPAGTAFFGFDATGGGVARNIAATANDETIATLTAMRLSTIATSETVGTRPDQRLAEAGRLGARYAVSGDVRAEGPRVKVTVRLEDVPSRVALWSGTLDGDAGQPLGAQAAALATDILSCFMQRMQGRENRTAELGALVARQCQDMRPSKLDMVQPSRELARLVPDSAMIQGTLGLEILFTLDATPPSAREALVTEGEAATRIALKLDPTDPWANLAHYQLLTVKGVPLAEREQALRKGLKSHPSDATLNFFLGNLLRGAGMIEASLPHMAVGVVGDPLSAPKRYVYAHAMMLSDKTAEAESNFDRAAMLAAPNAFYWHLRVRAAVFGGIGDLNDLLDHPPPPVSKESPGCWRDIAAALSQKNRAGRMAAGPRLRACVDSGAVQPDAGTMVAAQLGDLDTAFALADHPAPASSPGTLFIRQTAGMRLDPRFLKLAATRHWLDYWNATKQSPDFCRTEQAPVCAAIAGRSMLPAAFPKNN